MKKLLLGFFIFCAVSVSFGQKVWENKQLGFSIQKPENWFVSQNKQLIDILETPNLTDRHIEAIAQRFDGNVLVRFEKYNSKTSKGINPSIQVSLIYNLFNDFETQKRRLIATTEEFKRAKQNFKLIEEVKEIEVSGIKSLFCVIEFNSETKSGTILTKRSRAYFIPYKSYLFRVFFSDGNDGQKTADYSKEFEKLVETIKIGELNKN